MIRLDVGKLAAAGVGILVAACGSKSTSPIAATESEDAPSLQTEAEDTVSESAAECGNGRLDADEECDDGNAASGDGCSPACAWEPGWRCAGAPSRCQRDDDETPPDAPADDPPAPSESTPPPDAAPDAGEPPPGEPAPDTPSPADPPTEDAPDAPSEMAADDADPPNPVPTDTGDAPALPPLPTNSDASTECTNLHNDGVDADGINGASWIYSFGDGGNSTDDGARSCGSTHCLSRPAPDTVCFAGIVDEAGSDYACYGAAFGIQMVTTDDSGVIVEWWDAAALGVAGVRFTLEHALSGSTLRAQIATSQPDAFDNGASRFVHGGGTGDIISGGEMVLMFTDFVQPSWSSTPDAVIDTGAIEALEIHVTSSPSAPTPFDFCLTQLQWVDATGTPVVVPEPLLD